MSSQVYSGSAILPIRGVSEATEDRTLYWQILCEPEKPMILALSRADPCKNILALIHARSNRELRLVLNKAQFAGNADALSRTATR
ncbi:MAG: hypothetical protein AB8B63_00995 [Granulosicoccus sp.]